MRDFDPINLGKYIPRDMLELSIAHEFIIDAFHYMKVKIVGRMSLKDYEQKFGSKCAGLLAGFYDGLPSRNVLQVQCWEYLRHELVTQYVKAYVVDMSGSVNLIEHTFWVTDFAKIAFSTGELPSTPSYPHGGVIVVTGDDLTKLFGKYFEYFVNQYWVRGEGEYISAVKGGKLDMPGPRDNIPRPDGTVPGNVPVRLIGAGRPPAYDLDLFLSCMVELTRDAAPPATKMEMGRRAADSYERAGGRGGRPSSTWLKTQVQRFWPEAGPEGVSDQVRNSRGGSDQVRKS